MRIKTFVDTNPEDAESRVNRWLSRNPGIEVVQLAQSESGCSDHGPWSVTITLLYREATKEIQEEISLTSERALEDPVVMEFPNQETIGSA
ncbi:hypothetical protein JIN85_15780 [Luteolibacter pohnpeiensis]|uniref:Uncharacterized protein n=1 Tax=Luteolibacter pohnpeiensis TaxID=454153 RepID=A0A934SET6_9BACT|nr:hypothetical protein [Luteolibacter pohnpeiensis]MBK1883878.1 hypothetical protein [Luteolibacter pohnpeiensis]